MCDLRPGMRCPADARDVVEQALDTYRDAHPQGPDVLPLNPDPRGKERSRYCDTGAELRLVSKGGGVVAIEQVEFFADDELWLPGATLSPEASDDLGAWFADPEAHTSDRTRRTRKWEPTWTEGDLTFKYTAGTVTAVNSDGLDSQFIAELGPRDVSKMSVWLLGEAPTPSIA